MKRILSLISLIISLISCDNLLDLQPYGVVSTESFIKQRKMQIKQLQPLTNLFKYWMGKIRGTQELVIHRWEI